MDATSYPNPHLTSSQIMAIELSAPHDLAGEENAHRLVLGEVRTQKTVEVLISLGLVERLPNLLPVLTPAGEHMQHRLLWG